MTSPSPTQGNAIEGLVERCNQHANFISHSGEDTRFHKTDLMHFIETFEEAATALETMTMMLGGSGDCPKCADAQERITQLETALKAAVSAVDLVQRTIRHQGLGDLSVDQLLSALNSSLALADIALEKETTE